MAPILGTDTRLVGADRGSDTDNIIVTTNPLYIAQLTAEYEAFVERFDEDPILSQVDYQEYFDDDNITRLNFKTKFAAFPLFNARTVLDKSELGLIAPGLRNESGASVKYLLTNVGRFVVACPRNYRANAISRRLFWAKQSEFIETGNASFPRLCVSKSHGKDHTVAILEVSPQAAMALEHLSVQAYFGILKDKFELSGIVSAEDHPLRLLINPELEAKRIFGVKDN